MANQRIEEAALNRIEIVKDYLYKKKPGFLIQK